MSKYKEGYEQGKFDKEMEMLYETKLKCKMPYIDYLIVMLGMANIAVRINNHNLGDIHNIIISYYVRGESKIPKTETQRYWHEFRLPQEEDKLIEVLQGYLVGKGKDFMTLDEWVREYFV